MDISLGLALGSARLGCGGKRLQQRAEEAGAAPHDGDGGPEAEADGRYRGAGGRRGTRSQCKSDAASSCRSLVLQQCDVQSLLTLVSDRLLIQTEISITDALITSKKAPK